MVQSLTELPLVLTVRHIQDVLNVSKTTAYELVRSGKIPSIRIGRKFRVCRVAFAKYLGVEDETRATLPPKKGGDAT